MIRARWRSAASSSATRTISACRVRSRRRTGSRWLLCALLALPGPALAGPPYLSDDPQPTEFREYEIYLFTAGQHTRDGTGGAAGIDFNYGAAPGVQLTA